jgi:hypothetical protein
MDRVARWIALLVVLAWVAAYMGARVTRRARARRGWWVEPLSAAQLRGAQDEIAVVYHEGGRSLWFGGTRGGRGARDRLVVPGREAWDAEVEPWARGRRDEILERLAGDAYVARRVEFAESPGDPAR